MDQYTEIIYLTHNRLSLTKQSLPALLDCDPDINYKVYIHDNASSDGTQEWLRALKHPKIAGITYSDKNLGIAPVTNKFWRETSAPFIGKVDNDLVVPSGWIKDTLDVLKHAEKDNLGPVTYYHWIDEWVSDLDPKKMTIFTTTNGRQIARSSHTGGNYIMLKSLVNKHGYVTETQGLKGGFTEWQYRMNKIVGYIYPLKFFRQPAFYRAYDLYKSGKGTISEIKSFEHERKEAKRLLELKF